MRSFAPSLKFLPPFVMFAAIFFGGPVAEAEAATATGSGRLASETRTVSDFEAIAIAGSIKLEVRQSGKESVVVSADDNILPLIETVVEAHGDRRTLIVRSKRGTSYRPRSEIKVVVDVIRLTSVASAGAGDVLIEGLKTPLLKLSVAGSGDARISALTAEAMEVRIAGSGDVHAQGTAGRLKLSIAGSGDAALADLVADDVTISIAGSGDAQVNANKSLAATVAGSGDIKYRGKATAIRSSIVGSGKVTKMD